MQKHWADKLADKVVEERGDKDSYVFNFGMSLSGKMHIGNLRGELTIPSRVEKILKSRGKNASIRGVFYTQDPFKAKKAQLEQFDDPEEAKKYEGWRLKDVPDPEGCHSNWPEHFNSENSPYFEDFGINVDPITTTEFYRMDETKELVRKFLKNKDKVREILNQYRERNPYPEGWIPFVPFCENCKTIRDSTALDIDFDEGKVQYECECGDSGWSDIEEGKLTWRLEWSALWHVLDVDFEPYGKDHATPGGSRDSCVALCEEFDLNYPTGFAFNWVYWKRNGEVKDMTSSGNVGMTAKEFLEVSEPEVLVYLYMSTKPMKEIYFSPEDIPDYYRRFDRAERIYFGEDEARSEKRERNIKRNYELTVKTVPDKKPIRVPYGSCVMVAQLTSDKDRALELFKKMEQVPEDLSEEERKNILERLKKAGNWVERYGTEEDLIQVQESIGPDIKDRLSDGQINMLRKLKKELEEREMDVEGIQSRIYEMRDEFELSSGEVFSAIYLALLGEDKGPRAGQLIKALGEERVIS
ncbi:MAG: lysine--tRNA ligase, partial [Candidatus Aenigmatarchaeota archaeon]